MKKLSLKQRIAVMLRNWAQWLDGVTYSPTAKYIGRIETKQLERYRMLRRLNMGEVKTRTVEKDARLINFHKTQLIRDCAEELAALIITDELLPRENVIELRGEIYIKPNEEKTN